MPIIKPCRVLGCAGHATNPGSLCDKHYKVDKNLVPPEEEKRLPPHARGYDHNWRRIRKFFFKRNPMCSHCERPAVDVDHIVPIRAGGTNEFTNLQSLCRSCHAKKTSKDKNKYKDDDVST